MEDNQMTLKNLERGADSVEMMDLGLHIMKSTIEFMGGILKIEYEDFYGGPREFFRRSYEHIRKSIKRLQRTTKYYIRMNDPYIPEHKKPKAVPYYHFEENGMGKYRSAKREYRYVVYAFHQIKKYFHEFTNKEIEN